MIPVLLLFFCLALLAVSGFFAATETVVYLADETVKEQVLKKSRDEVLTFILLCNTILNIFIGLFSDRLAADYLPHSMPLVLEIAVTTTILLVAGEIIPKRFAIVYWERWQQRLLTFVAALSRRLAFLQKGMGLVIKPLTSIGNEEMTLDRFEMKSLLVEGLKNNLFDRMQADLVINLLAHANGKVKDIMIPYTVVTYVTPDSTAEEVFDEAGSTQLSHLPVVEKDFSHVYGLIPKKDLIPYKEEEKNEGALNLRSVMQPIHMVYEQDSFLDCIRFMRETGESVLGVHDEYFQFCGLADLGTIINRILFTGTNILFQPVIVPPHITLGSLHYRYSIVLSDQDDETTLADLISSRLQRIPDDGDELAIGMYRLKIHSSSNGKVRHVRIDKAGSK